MKIGVIAETKLPPDRRVPFTPEQLGYIKDNFNCEIQVESSKVRAFSDKEYEERGIEVTTDLSHCDYLFGVKEVALHHLIPNKHYFFFGHIAKCQEYNKPLLKKMMDLSITFTDYEYIVDKSSKRLVAFGWWAGAIGVYNTLRAYGLKRNIYHLPKLENNSTLFKMLQDLKTISLPNIKILITGKGRVSQGAEYVLNEVGIRKISESDFISNEFNLPCFAIAYLDSLVKRITPGDYCHEHFKSFPSEYTSDFTKYANVTDVFIPCHFWGVNHPVYLNKQDLRGSNLKIEVIGDVSCDIMGSIHATLRPSSHESPFYDYNPITELEETPFSSDKNITVMAIDNLPNALPKDTSASFGDQLIKHVIPELYNKKSFTVNSATILIEGSITDKYSYLNNFVSNV